MEKKPILTKPGRKRITTKVQHVLNAAAAFRKCFEEAPFDPQYPVNKVSSALQTLPEELLIDLEYLLKRARWATKKY